jgi:hypothetical protein
LHFLTKIWTMQPCRLEVKRSIPSKDHS